MHSIEGGHNTSKAGMDGMFLYKILAQVLSTQVCSFHPIPSSFQPKFGPRTRKMIQPHGSLQTLQILFKILADFLSGPAASLPTFLLSCQRASTEFQVLGCREEVYDGVWGWKGQEGNIIGIIQYSSISREKVKYVEVLKFEKEYACTFKKKLWYFLNTKDENASKILSYKDEEGTYRINLVKSRD